MFRLRKRDIFEASRPADAEWKCVFPHQIPGTWLESHWNYTIGELIPELISLDMTSGKIGIYKIESNSNGLQWTADDTGQRNFKGTFLRYATEEDLDKRAGVNKKRYWDGVFSKILEDSRYYNRE
ncbi:MAG: hypothetical protein WC476_01475 [Phycisphaerae bacterium]|jgi:hypothetical protein